MTIECRSVGVEIDGRSLLADVSLTVGAGEWVCVLGPNGAGKTTLLRAIAGLQHATGRVKLLGRPVETLDTRARAQLVALVPQSPVIPAGMRVFDYALLGRSPYLPLLAFEGPADLTRTAAALDALDLADLADRTVESLSGGERQRVVLARALAQDAPILLLDEPTTALDIGHQQDVLDLVEHLRRERDLTVCSTMHDLTLAGHYADRLVLLRDGRIVDQGAAAAVLTEANLLQHFGARVRVVDGPHGPVIVPEPRPIGARP